MSDANIDFDQSQQQQPSSSSLMLPEPSSTQQSSSWQKYRPEPQSSAPEPTSQSAWDKVRQESRGGPRSKSPSNLFIQSFH